MKKRMLNLIIALICCCGSFYSFAQQQIKGTVLDINKKTLDATSVILLKDSSVLASTVTKADGSFTLTVSLHPENKFRLHFSRIGYNDYDHIFSAADSFPDHFTLSPSQNLLNEVTLVSKRPLVVQRSDRFIVNIENSLLADGNTGLEVLRKIPGLWVNAAGAIRIKGSQPVTVMINDVVQRMSEDELAGYIASLRSEDISKIGVIQNPPAEFEASGSGGIIHIILKKARKNGLTGSLSTIQRLQGNKNYWSGGGSIDYKINRFYLSAGTSISRDRNDGKAFNNITYANAAIYNTDGARENDNRRQQFRVGVGYDINDRHSIRVQTTSIKNEFLNRFFTNSFYKNDTEQTSGNVFTNWERRPWFLSTSVNYLWKMDSLGSSLRIIGDHMYGNKTELNEFKGEYSDPLQNSTYRVQTPVGTNLFSLQGNYTKQVSEKIQFKTGAKFSHNYKNNELLREDLIGNEWMTDSLLSNRFVYNESVWMVYGTFEKAWKNTTAKAGLRFEETLMNGHSITSDEQFKRSYAGFFPSFFVSQKTGAGKNSVYVSYSRRLQRPGFRELNPYRLQFDNHTIMLGNPYLSPQYSNNAEAGYHFKNDGSVSFYLSQTNKVIGQLAKPVSGDVIEYQYQNLDRNTEYGINFSMPVNITKNWTAINSCMLYRSNFKIADLAVKQNIAFFMTSQTIRIKRFADIECYAEYRTRSVEANTINGGSFYSEVAAGRKILHNKVRIKIFCTDPFNLVREKEITDFAGTHIYFYQKRQTRNAGFSLTYNFSSGKKFTVTKVESGANEDRN